MNLAFLAELSKSVCIFFGWLKWRWQEHFVVEFKSCSSL
jgi:hypothetical protein